MATTATNSSLTTRCTRILWTHVLLLETYRCSDLRLLRDGRFHHQPSRTRSTLLAAPAGTFGSAGELAADLFAA